VKLRVVVLFGGRSAEHEISCLSARSVMDALDAERYEIVPVGITKEGAWRLVPKGPPPLPEVGSADALPKVTEASGEEVALSQAESALVTRTGERGGIDVVFPVLHGPYGEDGTVQGLLEIAGVPYVGSGVLGSALGMDKAVQKTLLCSEGLPVVEHFVVREREWLDDPENVEAQAQDLGYPVFVKPANLGSSVGITKCRAASDLPGAVQEALRHDSKAVVEASVEGAREIECAVLGNDDPTASVPGEIVPSREFYDYRAKYLDDASQLIIPAPLPEGVVEEVQRMAVAAFRAVESAGMARVDFLYLEPRKLWVNELNTIPGFTAISMYPKMWEASGIPYPELLDRLIELAIERGEALGNKTAAS